MPDDRGCARQEDPEHRNGASPSDEARPPERPAVGRRFFLADSRARTSPGRARLTEIGGRLADPASATRWYAALDLAVLADVSAAHGPLAQLLAGEPATELGPAASRRVQAVLEARGLGWLGDDGRREEHAQRAWNALYAAHYGVADAVSRVEPLTYALRVCRLAELAYSGDEPGWRELADAAAARPMVPAEIYRARGDRRPRPADAVVRAVAMPVAGGELDAAALAAGRDEG
ncbi:hypothetical protein I6A84_16495 [Frankia sp. CNm7]|uniref:Uncharacterized protein n=1 Tax=Frankia nepalensis TaxID=1836974 RepID=A0A937R5Z9_9ACTN|nr:hypothetical protein [Frankia nepalensis]MBL7496475.1 hypothetical protein [Frankia nepalensis]MBL7515293.1 hypothetical protein [Frankia nepalensis]MBL7519653.1 hypothetical protein [Frankia nepalensis]MBL7625881.1 hypothetical protein [Frankia nepalensis]